MKLFEVRLWYPRGTPGVVDRWRLGIARFASCFKSDQHCAPCIDVYRAPKSFGGTQFSWISHVHGEDSELKKHVGFRLGRTDRPRVVARHPYLLHDPAEWSADLATFTSDQLQLLNAPVAPPIPSAAPKFFPLKDADNPNPHWLDEEIVNVLRVGRDHAIEEGPDPFRPGQPSVEAGRLIERNAMHQRRELKDPIRLSTRWAAARAEVPARKASVTIRTEVRP